MLRIVLFHMVSALHLLFSLFSLSCLPCLGTRTRDFGFILYDELHWAEGKYQAFWKVKLGGSTEQGGEAVSGFEFLSCFTLYFMLSLFDFSAQSFPLLLNSKFYCHFTFSITCLCQYCN